ncbi:MAG TPA: isoprenylcysteine carboxylmethyltransferase family protein [Candidatus Omnitrophota bacterium]|jgi:protein-S-isoprenylcysteine O-methyltransferase Ste14|nr:isoprenylcysteine carboxylmethyltransferase family protein [Candidatus Omnitrophota bacterium]
MEPIQVAGAFWSVFALYWLVSSFGRNPARRRESPLARLAHLLYMGAAFILLYSRDHRFGFLDRRFVPMARWIEWAGALLTAAGVALAIWARRHIGKHWSAEVTIRHDHELIRTGPYARIRHPIYTGILLALFGTALILGEWRGLVAVGLAVMGFWWKARREESLLRQEFGERFDEHKRRTGFFLPRMG